MIFSKRNKELRALARQVEKCIDKLREPPANQEPLAVADHLERVLPKGRGRSNA